MGVAGMTQPGKRDGSVADQKVGVGGDAVEVEGPADTDASGEVLRADVVAGHVDQACLNRGLQPESRPTKESDVAADGERCSRGSVVGIAVTACEEDIHARVSGRGWQGLGLGSRHNAG